MTCRAAADIIREVGERISRPTTFPPDPPLSVDYDNPHPEPPPDNRTPDWHALMGTSPPDPPGDDMLREHARLHEAVQTATFHGVVDSQDEMQIRRALRRRPIATWPSRYPMRGELCRTDYPPGALTRNPPGYYTPEAHP